MPRQVTLQDGSQLEIPTDEEMAGYKTQASTIETLTKEKTELETAKKNWEADPSNKNWAAMRTASDNMKAALKAQGKEVKEDGTIVEMQPQLTVDQIKAEATKAARETVITQYKDTKLAAITDTEKRKVVEHYFSKLSGSEELTIEKVDTYLNQSMVLADPNAKPGTPFVTGQPPQINKGQDGKPEFGTTDEGKDIANQMFKGESFAQPPKQ